MFVITYAAAFLAIIFAVGAAAFFFWRRDNVLVRILACYLLSASVWIGANAAADVSYTPDVLIVMSQLAFSSAILTLFCFTLLVDFLVEKKLPSLLRTGVYAAVAIFFCILGFSPSAILGEIFPAQQASEIIPGAAYTYALFLLIFVFIYGIVRLTQGLKRERNYTQRMQMLYILVGLLITVFGQLFFDALLPLFGELSFYSLGPLTSVFFAAGCAYAITRHKLFDIRIVIQRGAVYSILLAMIVSVYLILIETFGAFIGSEGQIDILLSAGLTTVLGIFSAPIVEQYFRKLTDRVFFKDRYDYAEAMHSLSEILYTHTELAEIIESTEEALCSIFRSSSVRIILSGANDTDHSSTLAIPILLEGNEVATIFLGGKRSGDPYTESDMQLLNTFAYQAATALSRARLYEEVRQLAGELSAKVEERTEELRKAHESQRQIMIDISHNLQTPLTVFQMKIEALKQLFKNDPEILNFEHSLANLSRFIYDLLSLAKLEQIQDETQVPFSLSELLDEICEEVTIIANTYDISVTSKIETGCNIRGNKERVREALLNIVSNSIKYMRADGERKIHLSLSTQSGCSTVTIADTGAGIPEDEVLRIFERFYRGRSVDKKKEGTGLGLAIVKRIVEAHGGTVSVESRLSAGTTVRIGFPSLSSLS
jgi:signal transduction histidine kinase